jgi:putative restriction endonuclease
MRYWWVNQKQTYRHEVPGGYMWSPKRKSNGHRNPFYEFMREVAPGDIVFSFADGAVKAIGVAVSHGYESPKPLEFGEVGAYWNMVGWRVDVQFRELKHSVRPADYMDVLSRHLPRRYAPLQPSGHGLQSVYLTELPETFATALADLVGHEARVVLRGAQVIDSQLMPARGLEQWESHQLSQLSSDASIPDTTRQALVQARRGQGQFKQNVMRLETRCRLTGVDRIEHLRASHCKPWRDASNEERLDGENGLLLTPDADHLFDRGFLTFEDNGDVVVSPVAHLASLTRMGLDPARLGNVGGFSKGQKSFLSYHRDSVFLQAKLG